MLQENIVDSIGRTPLIKLRLSHEYGAPVFAKMELMNPYGMKDRVAKYMIQKARNEGILRDGDPIVESSSGTMALGLALVGTYYGHAVHIVTDPRIDSTTYLKLKSMGCHVHIVQNIGEQGWQSARLDFLKKLIMEMPNAFWPRQYENPDNPSSYEPLASETMNALEGQVDILVGSVGSGGSLCGTAKSMRKYNPNLLVVAVDSVGSVLFNQPDNPHRLQSGLGNSILPGNVDHDVIDMIHWLNDKESFTATRLLASRENIFAGNSSGSVYMVASWLSKVSAPDKKIVAIFPDRGDRYANTVFNEEYSIEKIDLLEARNEPKRVPYGTIVDAWSYSMLGGDILEEYSIHRSEYDRDRNEIDHTFQKHGI